MPSFIERESSPESVVDSVALDMYEEETLENTSRVVEGEFYCNEPGDIAPGSNTDIAMTAMDIFYEEKGQEIVNFGMARGKVVCREADAEPVIRHLGEETLEAPAGKATIAVVLPHFGAGSQFETLRDVQHSSGRRPTSRGSRAASSGNSPQSLPGRPLAAAITALYGQDLPMLIAVTTPNPLGGQPHQQIARVKAGDYRILSPGQSVTAVDGRSGYQPPNEMCLLWSEHTMLQATTAISAETTVNENSVRFHL